MTIPCTSPLTGLLRIAAMLAAVSAAMPPLAGADVNWGGGDPGDETNFNNAANWDGGVLPALYDESAGADNGDVAVFDGSGSIVVDNKTPTLTAPYGDGVNNSTSWGLLGVRFVDSGWTLDTGSERLYLSWRGGADLRSEATSGTNTVNGGITFGANNTNNLSEIYVETGGTLRLNANLASVIDGGSNAFGSVEKRGGGTLELNTTGATGGGLIVYEGTVKFFAETAGGVTGDGRGGLGSVFNRSLNINGGVVDINGAANQSISTLTLSLGGELTNSSLTTRTITTRAGGSNTLSGLISGNLNMAFNANATATTTLSNLNTYTGTTTILNSAGGGGTTIVVAMVNSLSGQAGAFGNSTSAITLGSTGNSSTDAQLLTGAAVEIGRDIVVAGSTNANSDKMLGAKGTQVGNSTFSGDITIGTGLGGAKVSLTAPTAVTVSFTGDILEDANAAAGVITKVGLGTVRLTGNNTYAGGTTVSEGVLILDNASGSATGTGDVTVLADATLGGGNLGGTTGFAGGMINLAADAHLAPGQSAGTLTLQGGLTLNSTGGSILDFELGGLASSDLLMITGGNFNGNSSGLTQITIAELGGFGVGSYTLIDWTGATLSDVELGDFQLLNDTYSGGRTGSLQMSGSELQLVVVPEPHNSALLIGVLGIVVCFVRRRK